MPYDKNNAVNQLGISVSQWNGLTHLQAMQINRQLHGVHDYHHSDSSDWMEGMDGTSCM